MLATVRKCEYLQDIPIDLLNDYGLAKTLLTRRETIYLKHVLKNLFVYGNEADIQEKIRYVAVQINVSVLWICYK